MDEKLLTVSEVSRYLNISEDEVGRLVERGELSAYKIGGSILRFKQEHVERYRKGQAPPSGPGEDIRGGRGVKSDALSIGERAHMFIERKSPLKPVGTVQYRFMERLEDFLYYNDFYILSLILLVLVLLAVFQF